MTIDFGETGILPKTHVYVARAGNYMKIGATRDVSSRLAGIQRGGRTKVPVEVQGVPLTLVAVFETPHALSLERALQDAFTEQWVAGEWFLIDDRLRRWLSEREALQSMAGAAMQPRRKREGRTR